MPSKEKERVYWDSCVFIDLLQRTPGRIEILQEYAMKAEKGELEIVTSAFALVEVAKLPNLGLSDSEIEQKIVGFFDNPYIILRAVDRRVSTKAREIMRAVKMKGKDAVHVASAALSDVSVLHTYDGPLQRAGVDLAARGIIFDQNGSALRIEEPADLRPPLVQQWDT